MRLSHLCATLGLAFTAISCAPQGDLKNAAPAAPVGEDFFLAVANQYDKYPRYDNVARQAPMFCALAITPKIDVSRSEDSATHGQKLFYLYTRDRERYMNATAKRSLFLQGLTGEAMLPVPGGHAVTQILVKESFLPGANGPDTTRPHDLFLMVQFPPQTPNTDDGWVFAVVTPDRKTVKQFGQVQSCVTCHAKAPFDHQFGLPSP